MDVLAYNTHYQALTANFLANEMFMDTAEKRTSVVSHAKALGYTPKSITAPRATINLVITNAPNFSGVLPYGTKFNASVNNKAYTFSTTNEVVTQPTSGTFTFVNLAIYEGYYITNELQWDGVDDTIQIPNNTCDVSTLRVWVWDDSQHYVEYTRSGNILSIDGTSQIFFVQEGFYGLEIYFGDGVLGFRPNASVSAPTMIKMSYIVTNGASANNASNFTLASSLGVGNETAIVNIKTQTQADGGSAQESIQSIKLQAINNFSSQNRAVIVDDYIYIIKSMGINTKSVTVWGGEDNTPPQYGAVMICIEPIIGDNITSADQAQITTVLKSKCVANTKFNFLNPDYIDLLISCNVSYKSTTLTSSSYELEVAVKQAIIDYTDTTLTSFDSAFRQSNLSAKIDLLNESILSNSISVSLLKKIIIGNNTTEVKTSFNNMLNTSNISPTITSNTFSVDGSSELVWIDDDKLGILNLMIKGPSGVKIYKSKVGVVNYTTGDVYVNPMIYSNVDGAYLRLTATPISSDIFSKKSSIVRATIDNIAVTSTAQK